LYNVQQISLWKKKQFNDFLKSCSAGNIFQTYEWGELKKSSGWHPIRLIVEKNGQIFCAVTLLKRKNAGMTMLYSPRGPVLDYDNQAEIISHCCRGVTDLSHKEKAVFWRIDPELIGTKYAELLTNAGFSLVPVNNPFGGIQPKWVWRITLSDTPDHQWKLLKQSGRKWINKALKNKVEIKEGTAKDIPILYRLLKETSNRSNFLLRSSSYYHDLWTKLAPLSPKMVLAFHEGQPVSAILVVGFGQGVWGICTGNSASSRGLGASYLLNWEVITWAIHNGYKFYDMGGIAPEADEHHPLGGLKIFKSHLGGSAVEFVGEYDLVFKSPAYRLWNIGQKSFNTIKKFKKLIR